MKRNQSYNSTKSDMYALGLIMTLILFKKQIYLDNPTNTLNINLLKKINSVNKKLCILNKFGINIINLFVKEDPSNRINFEDIFYTE